MITVSLYNLRFFSFHGIHEEEKTIAGEFEVNVELKYEQDKTVVTHIGQTIDYSTVYALVKERMSRPTPLLETIAMELAHTIKKMFPVIKEITIRIKKVHPPIPAFTGEVAVSYTEHY